MKNKIIAFLKKYYLYFLLIILALVLLIWVVIPTFSVSTSSSTWDGTVATSFHSGNGSANSPYEINNGSELAYFKNISTSTEYFNKYYILTNNININGLDFSNTNYGTFSGNFNGKGFSIYNLLINNNSSSNNMAYYGLFSNVNNANISNLNIYNITMNITNNSTSYVGLLGCNATNTSINNISIYNLNMNINASNITGGGLFATDNGGNSINNLNIDTTSNNGGVASLIGTYNNATTTNVLVKNNGLNIYNNTTSNNVYSYTVDDDKNVTLSNGNASSIITSLNNNNSYTWQYKKGVFSLTNVASNNDSTITEHNTGVDSNIVYLNDLTSDYNYYLGLNYTTSSSSGKLPTMDNKNINNDTNLIKTEINYNGTDISGTNTGYVSITEKQNKYVYYKYYTVNNNNTSDLNDDYVEIELIDNPFTNRPNNMAFNGWVTDNNSATISFDNDYYKRYIKVPITYSNNKPNNLVINLYASWISATTYEINTTSNVWSTAFNTLNSAGMHSLNGTRPIYGDVSNYYIIGGTISAWNTYPNGDYYDEYGDNISGEYCWSSSCTYYKRADSTYDSSKTYYSLSYNGAEEVTLTPTGYESYQTLAADSPSGGYFKKLTINYNNSINGYYNASGTYQTGKCKSSSGCELYELIPYYDETGNVNKVTNSDLNNYYYLVTRETNIIVLERNQTSVWSSSNDKPFTLTSINNGRDYRSSAYLNAQRLAIKAYADMTLENIKIYSTTSKATGDTTATSSTSSSAYFYGNFHNTKIGRGITANGNYINLTGFIGGNNSTTGTSSNITKYSMTIESGLYNTGTLTAGGIGYDDNEYISGKATYGNDFDRANTNNNNLIIYSCLAGSWGAEIYGINTTTPAMDSTYKSGSFGLNKSSNIAGTYIGGRQGGDHYAPYKGTIEGGWFYNVIGGPISNSSRTDTNDLYLYVKGGEITTIWGGAGVTATYGNRIIQMTSGIVDHSLFGGSCAYGGSDGDGTIKGSSFIYLGGDAQIGSTTNVNNNTLLYGAESGSLFGNGDGKDGYSAIGSNDNSYIIIDGNAKVLRNIYGGGNYGATGVESSATNVISDINILNGTINGNVYGGGNNNGAGSSSKDVNININMTGGTINGSVFGGSRILGTIYGSTNVNIIGGTVVNDIYGGGEGGYTTTSAIGTYVAKNTNVTIGSSNVFPTISGDIYGGSAYGTVNATSINDEANNYTTNVTLTNGNITGSIYGGAKGSDSVTPYVKGNINVNIDGGTATNVYGGFNQSGTLNGISTINLNSGIIGSTYGGGQNAGLTTSNVNLKGSTVTNIFGGSNISGEVNKTNITTTNGTVTSIYGGNNIGGITNTSNVNINGATINGDIYGGGYKANTIESNVILSTSKNNLSNIYGGGNEADVTTTNVTNNGITANNIYGGSNQSGTITNSNLTITNGTVTNVYGGNNQGGTTITSNVIGNGGTITNIYGGGNVASTKTSTLTINSGTITNAYAGGNNAKVDTTNFNILGGTIESAFGSGNNAGSNTTLVNAKQGNITSLYGGANQSGDVTTSTINTLSNGETVTKGIDVTVKSNVRAVTWESKEYKTIATLDCTVTNNTGSQLDKWNIYINVPNSTIFNNYSASNINAINGYYTINEINRWYGTNSLAKGASYSFEFNILTNTEVSDFGAISGSTITDNLMITNLYGGNNQGGTTTTTNINTNAGIISNLYGGGRKADIVTSNVNLNDGIIGNVYGGGDTANVNQSTNLKMTGGLITTNFYGGGNQGEVLENTNVYVSGGTISCSLYAGGNGATATVIGNTNIAVSGTAIVGYKGAKAPNSGSIFGGGNAATTGTNTINGSKAIVNIAGGYIYGNVYGGANTAAVYGKTAVNVGKYVTLSSDIKKGDITILGTIFGGGEANASGSENYDYSFISVTNGIDVNIDGDTYDNITINGSIFGSGDASSTSGLSNITIKNYGTYTNPKNNISIQRTNKLIIDNSSIHLTGATDRTNEYSDVLFTLSIIDELNLKNSSTLYLENTANLLKVYKSLDASDNLETINIDTTNKTLTTNTTNRIYMLTGKNLNIATNESVTSYGTVSGMTFFGIFQKDSKGTIKVGIYDTNKGYGDTLSWADMPDVGGYVLGLHKANHDINSDGFYTNNIDVATTTNIPKIIKPTPEDMDYYMWVVGDLITEYSVNLTASKYSTLGIVDLPMRDFAKPNTTYSVVGFDSSNLADQIKLTSESYVPRIANDSWNADRNMALVMESTENGWLNDGSTTFRSDTAPNIEGTKTYIGDNTKNIPHLSFYLYHSKNLGSSGDMGSVKITLLAITKIDDLTSEAKRIVITVKLSRALYTTNDYEGAITTGRKYSLFAGSETNITNKSSLSAYFSLYDNSGNIYKSGYHRSLVSSYVLPLNTKITMIDLSNSSPKYYYHVITDTDVTNATKELTNSNDSCSYNLSEFELMGTQNSNQYYSDSTGNSSYYHNNASSEEFIFILDFQDANIPSNLIDEKLLMELRSDSNATVKSVLSAEYPNMKYSIYANNDTIINTSGTINKTKVYAGETPKIDLTTTYNSTKVNGSSNTIQDTRYFDSKLGIKISILDSNNNIVSGTSLMGLYYKINGVEYHPNMDGTTRIKLADKVGNSLTKIDLVTNTATMSTGDYKIHIETFGSPDGIYYGLNPSSSTDINMTFVNQNYGLDIKVAVDSLIINHATGYNLNDTNNLSFNINYNSTLTNPHINMKLYRRSYKSIYDTNYELVDLKDYVSNTLINSSNEEEYLVVSNPVNETSLNLLLKDNLKTGTYKLEFILYDNTTPIDSIQKYIIIK
jgi:hypothetical protein